MADSAIMTVFDEIYEATYGKALAYVTRKCGNAEDIADILQEIYAEVFIVLTRKGPDYLLNSEAFVLRVAKMKIYRHYSLAEKLKAMVPMFIRNRDGEEVNVTDLERTEPSIEDQWINHLLIEDVARMITSKPSEVQKAFYLFYYLEMTIPQIASELAIKESTAKSRIYRTLKEIRLRYGRDGDT